MDIAVLRSAAWEIGSRSTNAADGCLYDLLQTRFPMDLLWKLIKVTDVNKNAAARAARSTAVDERKSLELAHLEAVVHSWPSLPSVRVRTKVLFRVCKCI
jgi:hypothetical protein